MSSTFQAKCLTEQEVNACLECLEKDRQGRKYLRNYLMFVMMVDAGLRVGELVQLKLSDFLVGDQFTDALRVRADIAKCNVARVVPLTKRLQQAIRAFYTEEMHMRPEIKAPDGGWLPKRDGFVFASDAAGSDHMTTRQVERIIKNVGNVSIGRELTPHMLRHTYGTNLAAVSPTHVVKELLGHLHLSSTQVYTHANGNDCRKAIEAMEKGRRHD